MTTTKLNPELTFVDAKTTAASAPVGLIARENFNELPHSRRPGSLLLGTGPAGYGKRTGIAERLDALQARTAWYRLEESDTDPRRFAAYLARTLNQSVAPELSVPGRLRNAGYDSLESVLSDLLGELPQEEEPLYLVLDDYHLISNPDIHQALRRSEERRVGKE